LSSLRLATRGSALALAQAELAAQALRDASPGLEVELVPITTSGDERAGGAPAPAPLGDKSRFVKEIEEALLDGRADVAVHSAKDVPGEVPEGLAIVGVPDRADPRDALVGAESLAALPQGASVGTSSLRRRSQLLALRPDLAIVELRGNVDTRLRKLSAGDYDAIVLACAGLARLGCSEGSPLPEAEMTPAPGQGCLLLEGRAGDERVAELASLVTDRAALLELTAERAVVAALDATCHTPVAARAAVGDGRLTLSVYAGMPDGSTWMRDEQSGPAEQAVLLGEQVAERLLAAGARELLDAAERAAPA
jgi:hydroxymethylbilane synthase